MRDRRIPQQLVTGGGIAGNPAARITGGRLPSPNRFRFVGATKIGVAGALDYGLRFESRTDARSAELVEGELVDDLVVLGGTAVGG